MSVVNAIVLVYSETKERTRRKEKVVARYQYGGNSGGRGGGKGWIQ